MPKICLEKSGICSVWDCHLAMLCVRFVSWRVTRRSRHFCRWAVSWTTKSRTSSKNLLQRQLSDRNCHQNCRTSSQAVPQQQALPCHLINRKVITFYLPYLWRFGFFFILVYNSNGEWLWVAVTVGPIWNLVRGRFLLPPQACNRLPTQLKLMRSTPVFERSFKTFLFKAAYCS